MSDTEKSKSKCARAPGVARSVWILERLLTLALMIGIGAVQTPSPSNPTKEYVHLNERVIAVR